MALKKQTNDKINEGTTGYPTLGITFNHIQHGTKGFSMEQFITDGLAILQY